MTSTFGSWPSPLTASIVAAGGVGLGGPSVRTSETGTEVWWSELRPTEGGRVVLVRSVDGGPASDVLAAPFSARTRVHEYGGGASFLGADTAYFSNWDDQRLHRVSLASNVASEPLAITPEPEEPHAWRFADGVESPDASWIVCVSEDHHAALVADHGEAVNALVAVPAAGGEPIVLSDRSDFVAAPRISPDGQWISWISWDHPNMPWDETRLLAAPLWANESELRIGKVTVVSEGCSAVGAAWTSANELVFSTDVTGFWNLNGWEPESKSTRVLTALDGAEIGGPQWVFGLQRWVELGDDHLAVVITTDAVDSLALLAPNGSMSPIETPFVAIGGLASFGTAEGERRVAVVGHSADALPCIAVVDATASPGQGVDAPISVVRAGADLGVDPAWFAVAEGVGLTVGRRSTHAFYYPPTGPVSAPDGELPPLVVMGHGGPTAHSSPDLSLKVQFWTSRGFGVADVNYGGSTGYGREYRRLLDESWGIVDVEDCVAVAEHLAATGRVDPERIAIRGGSAGGFTVLRALQVSDVFSAGTSLYGVADLEALATDTHKFESRYLDGLIGPYPEAKSVYDARSPINHTADLSCPLLVLQGSEDEVVPPNQSEAIVAAVAEKGIPHAYLLFEGEQHGFRQEASIIRSLEAELWFYGRVFGFEPADPIDPVDGAVGL